MKLVGMVSLGCPKNLVDSENLLGLIASKGYVITSSLEEAEIIIINTCGFIRPAVQEALGEILQCVELKKNGKCRHLIVAGCLTQRYGVAELTEKIPEVDLWLGVNTPHKVLDYLYKAYHQEKISKAPDDSPRLLTTPPFTAYLKIAEGCSHSCAYCLIPSLRGRLKSRPLDEIRREASALVANGVKELVLVAQDTGAYGKDLAGNPSLAVVLKELAGIPDLQWIRILYLNPSSIMPELVETIQHEPKICRYLDIPMQHASSKVLRKMGRKGDAGEYLKLIDSLRSRIPGLVLRTTLMTGFPGEDEQAFQELLEFVKKAQFDRLGVFPYYHEEGTRSFREKETVSFFEKRRRRREILKLQSSISRRKNEAAVGKNLPVLIEKKLGKNVYTGRSYREAPDIDPKIIVRGEDLRPGNFVNVIIRQAYTFDLAGTTDH